MYKKEMENYKNAISEANARRLQTSQPLYCRRLQYQDVAEHTFPVSNFFPLRPLQHMKDCTNYSPTSYIYSVSWLESTQQLQ
jgi:hypothetical protein